MNSRKRKGQLESMIGKIFVLSLFLILLVNLIVPNKEKSEEETGCWRRNRKRRQFRSFPEITWNNGKSM